MSEELLSKGLDLALNFGARLLATIAIMVVGWWLSRLLAKGARMLMSRAKFDLLLVTFLGNVLYAMLLVFVFIAAINRLGIQTASLVAAVGAAGLAIGLALQGALSNVAAGVLIVIFRPYRIGDYIEAGGTAGTVQDVQLLTTVLRSPDQKTVIVPNSQVMANSVTNYSTSKCRRIDLIAGVGYQDNIDQVKQILRDIVAANKRILADPAPTIAVLELADSSVNFAVRPWVNSADYWPVRFALTEQIKKEFDRQRISIPFPQRDVHLYDHTQRDAEIPPHQNSDPTTASTHAL